MRQVQFDAVRNQRRDEQFGQRTEIDVRAVDKARGCDGFTLGAPRHHERRPLVNHGGVVGEFGTGEQWVRSQCVESLAKVFHVVRTPDETDVRNGNEEGFRVGNSAVVDQCRPHFTRQLKLLIDLYGACGRNGSVRHLRCVVQFAQCRVPGSRVVPGIGGLRRE